MDDIDNHAEKIREIHDNNQHFIFSKLVGVTFNDRQSVIKGLMEGEILTLTRQPDNEFDKNAILVLRSDSKEVGHINRELAAELSPAMDKGINYICTIKQITGQEKDIKGVNIEIRKTDDLIVYNCFVCARAYTNKKDAQMCCKI